MRINKELIKSSLSLDPTRDTLQQLIGSLYTLNLRSDWHMVRVSSSLFPAPILTALRKEAKTREKKKAGESNPFDMV